MIIESHQKWLKEYIHKYIDFTFIYLVQGLRILLCKVVAPCYQHQQNNDNKLLQLDKTNIRVLRLEVLNQPFLLMYHLGVR